MINEVKFRGVGYDIGTFGCLFLWGLLLSGSALLSAGLLVFMAYLSGVLSQ